MIKLNAELLNDKTFKMNELEHRGSCTLEALCVISTMIDQIEQFGGIPRKELYKEIKNFDKMWQKNNKQIEEENIEEI